MYHLLEGVLSLDQLGYLDILPPSHADDVLVLLDDRLQLGLLTLDRRQCVLVVDDLIQPALVVSDDLLALLHHTRHFQRGVLLRGTLFLLDELFDVVGQLLFFLD